MFVREGDGVGVVVVVGVAGGGGGGGGASPPLNWSWVAADANLCSSFLVQSSC